MVGTICGVIATVVGGTPGRVEGDDAPGGVPASPRGKPLAIPPAGGRVGGTRRVVAVCVAGTVVGGGVLVLVLVFDWMGGGGPVE